MFRFCENEDDEAAAAPRRFSTHNTMISRDFFLPIIWRIIRLDGSCSHQLAMMITNGSSAIICVFVFVPSFYQRDSIPPCNYDIFRSLLSRRLRRSIARSCKIHFLKISLQSRPSSSASTTQNAYVISLDFTWNLRPWVHCFLCIFNAPPRV